MPDKLDLHRLLKNDYVAPRKPVLLDLAEASYLAIEGRGEPGGLEFESRIGSLYAMAYTIKMSRKFGGEQDYTIGRLEGQWWAEGGRCFSEVPREQWCWRLLIRTPEFVSTRELEQAAGKLRAKGKAPEARDVKLEKLAEGRCVQMLHVGPYDREGQTVAIMQAFAASKGLTLRGRHHEIYISDPRRVSPERLKTILRHPVG